MRSRIIFYNRNGYPLDEIAATTTRSWVLNGLGECSFVFPRLSPKLTKELIEFGNFVVVRNPYTKPWIGVIDTDRSWTRLGPRIKAYSAEVIFAYQQDQEVDDASNIVKLPITMEGSAGSIYKQLIQRANEEADTLLRFGDIFDNGEDSEEVIKSDYLTHIRALALRSSNDWDVTYALSANNTLVLAANWYERKGVDLVMPLEEGVNVQAQEEIAVEQGVIMNSILVRGAGSTDATRIGVVRNHGNSIGQYGIRRGTETFSSIASLSGLINNANSILKRKAYPRVTAKVTCVDPAMFNTMNEGDRVPLILHNAGFINNNTIGTHTTSRILALQAADATDVLDVVIDTFKGND